MYYATLWGGLSIGRMAWGVENCPGGGGGVPPPHANLNSPPPPPSHTVHKTTPPRRCSLHIVYIIHNNAQINTNTQHKSTKKKLYIACMIHNTEATKHGPIYNIVYYTHNKIKRK